MINNATFLEFIVAYQKEIYLAVPLLLVVFLYGSQAKGVKDYEKYANLALNDNLDDEPIEPRIKNERGTR